MHSTVETPVLTKHLPFWSGTQHGWEGTAWFLFLKINENTSVQKTFQLKLSEPTYRLRKHTLTLNLNVFFQCTLPSIQPHSQ